LGALEIVYMQQPLSERLRPRTVAEIEGQEELLGTKGALGKLLESYRSNPAALREKAPPSMIFWGPPGCGKTTLARLLAAVFDAEFRSLSAVSSGVKELRAVLDEAQSFRNFGKRTLLFVDEIHRFNKSQQDALLPAVEEGLIVFVGATTENPSFELNRALLSRCHLFVLNPLGKPALEKVLERAEKLVELQLEPAARDLLIQHAGGDARELLNRMDFLSQATSTPVLSKEDVESALSKFVLKHDRAGEEHYNLASALHKALRNSNVDATLYYLMRLLDAGEPPSFIARRLVRAAAEDIGLADPQALVQAVAAQQAAELLGYPECDVILAQAAAYLALAPKSNALYQAVKEVKGEIERSGQLPIPLPLRNAPTKEMKDLGYGKDYLYDHDYPGGVSPMSSMPEELSGRSFYRPSDRSFERELEKRIEYFKRLRKENSGFRG
jgi:putative ATPase